MILILNYEFGSFMISILIGKLKYFTKLMMTYFSICFGRDLCLVYEIVVITWEFHFMRTIVIDL